MLYRRAKSSYRQALLVSAAVLISIPAGSWAETALPFATATVEMAQAPLERIYDGKVEAVHKATMSAQTSGRVAEVFYEVDDYVEPGAPIVRFTDTEQQAALRQADAALAETIARQKQAEEEFRRAASLFEAQSSSKREYDQALATRDAAVARVQAMRSALDAARQKLEYTLVRAPYAGIVTERYVEVGEAVSVGQPLMSGLSLEALRVVVDLPQQVATKVRKYQTAAILTADGRIDVAGLTIFPFADSASNTFTARVEMPPGQFSLYPGMFVKVAFVIGDSERLMVPTAALVRRSEVTGVYVISDESELRLRQIRVGINFGDRTEVLAGLSDGEQIALDPVQAGIYLKSTIVANDEK